ncbi:MAG: DUF533 domain-containing protein [Candidatus Eremiobacterota bacterium]
MDDRQKEIVKALIQMAWVDGRWAEEEEAMLANVLVRMGCTEEEVAGLKQTMQERPDMAHLETFIPDRPSRLNAMRVLLAVSFADGALASQEYEYIQRMAHRLDIGPEDLEQLRKEALKMRSELGSTK